MTPRVSRGAPAIHFMTSRDLFGRLGKSFNSLSSWMVVVEPLECMVRREVEEDDEGEERVMLGNGVLGEWVMRRLESMSMVKPSGS